MKSILLRHYPWIEIGFFFVVAGILYLPFARHFGYYNDDWYSMYAARVAGPGIFPQLYSLDSRPGRALVMIPLYMLFQGDPFYYNLSAYFFRVLGAVTLLWMLRLVWQRNLKETFLASLLFLVYPGFLSQPIAIDFQSHLVGIWMAFLSIGLSIKAVFDGNRSQRILLGCGAILSGWLYLSQMEYYIGFEAVRLGMILMIFFRNGVDWRNARNALKSWFPYFSIPAAFLIWRTFFFTSQRISTNVTIQLGQVISNPILTLPSWLIYFFQDIANVTFLAWSVPLTQLGFNLRLRDSLIALGLSVLVLGLFYLVFGATNRDLDEKKKPTSAIEKEALWLGVAWVICGLIPVILGNRHIVYPDYSRYGFVSAGGAVIFLVALIRRLSGKYVQLVACGVLLVSATVTHYANGVSYAVQADDIRAFWWQVSWRVPQFEQGTTIVADYSRSGVRETSFVWGPANQIYYPLGVSSEDVQTGISALLLDRDSVLNILDSEKSYLDQYHVVKTYPDPRHIIILTQPTPYSCVHVMDGHAPEYSTYDDPILLAIGSHSDPRYIRTQESFQQVPEYLFGAEPDHGWCYYYEKASLARQQGNWNEVLRLAKVASDNNLRPDDLIEWMPFLQAYARNGMTKEMTDLAHAIWSEEYVANQACKILSNMPDLSTPTRSIIESKYCLRP